MIRLLLGAVVLLAATALLVRVIQPQLAFFPFRGEQDTPASLGLRFAPATLTTADGETLNAWLIPAVPAAAVDRDSSPVRHARAFVLYFHGNGGNLSVWLPILAGVAREGYTVAAIDYRGYGKSSGSPSEHGLYRDVDAALAWIATVRPNDIPLVFWGRSLGASMASYAATKVRPDGLILEAGFPDVRTLFRGSLMSLLLPFSSYRFPAAEYVKQARCPLLVMHGDRDSVIPFAAGRALFDAAPEPKQFATIRGGGHNEDVPPDPTRYWTVVHEFVASLRM